MSLCILRNVCTKQQRFFKHALARRCISYSHRRTSLALLHDSTCIGGDWLTEGQHGTFDVYNPSSEGLLGVAPNMGTDDTLRAIEAAKEAFEGWRSTTAKVRSDILKQWHRLLQQHREELSQIIVAENGKTLGDARNEVDYGNDFVEWFAEEGRRTYGDVVPSPVANRRMLFLRQPIGVAGLITPWNFPLAMFTRKAAAALAAGCTVVSKPAEDTPFSVTIAAKLAEEAGLPPGVLNVVTCAKEHAPEVGKVLCESLDVGVISFTGSSHVGKILMKQAAESVKRVSLELGGNAPFIVFESADLKSAVAGFIASKFRCSGQTCISSNRLLIQDSVHDEFVALLQEAMKPLRVGDGMEEGVTQGPLVNRAAVDKVDLIVQDAVSRGAKVVCGGKPHSKGGNFYELTVLQDVDTDMLCFQEEIFGPVVGVVRFSTESEALSLANMTQAGLAANFFSSDYSQIWRVSERLEAGIVGVNTGLVTCVEGLFSGWKQSGVGVESGKYGIGEYLEHKYIAMGGIEAGVSRG